MPVLALVPVLGAAAALGTLHLTSPLVAEVGPGRVELRAGLAERGATTLLLAPFGSVSASTHDAPLALSARIEEVDVERVRQLALGDRPDLVLRHQVEADLDDLARRFLVRSLALSALVGAVAGALLPHRRWTFPLFGALGAVAATGGLLVLAWGSYDTTAFEEPTFRGPVEQAPRLLDTARRYVTDFDAVRDRAAVLSAQITELYAATTTDAIAGAAGETRILHVSDIHLNPVGLEITDELARQFEVDAVLDTGDLTTFGLDVEGRFGALLGDLPVPYYLVPGNHDSPANRVALGGAENVTLLDGDVVTIGDVEILGVGEPSFTASNELDDDDVAENIADQAPLVRRLVRRERPDVLAVHDPRQAEAAYGRVPLALSGHLHRQRRVTEDGTRSLTVGSTGATGLGAFTVETDLHYEAQVLRFVDGDLVAVDYVALRGVAGDFRITRNLIEDETDDDTDDDTDNETVEDDGGAG